MTAGLIAGDRDGMGARLSRMFTGPPSRSNSIRRTTTLIAAERVRGCRYAAEIESPHYRDPMTAGPYRQNPTHAVTGRRFDEISCTVGAEG